MVDLERIKLDNSRKKRNQSDSLWRCSVCNRLIYERYCLKISDLSYHPDCLQCVVCGIHLTESCFMREERVYCRQHFYTRFGGSCSACHLGIRPTEIVHRSLDNVYHLHCFCCDVCNRQLNTGDQYYLLGDLGLICKSDFDAAECRGSESELKRPRTTIGSHQLDTLKAAYNKSSKPSRHVREKLSRETGLDMRVVQVWFQNRRAKEKRLKKDAGRQRGTWGQNRSSNRNDMYLNNVFLKDTRRNDACLHDSYGKSNNTITNMIYTDFH